MGNGVNTENAKVYRIILNIVGTRFKLIVQIFDF